MTRLRADDDGLTLVEIIVTVVIGGLFLGLLGALFANGLIAQQQATARDRATGYANVLGASLGSSLRNATSDVTVSADGQAVVAKVVTGEGDWECRAWLVGPDGSVHYAAVAKELAPLSMEHADGWRKIITGKERDDGTVEGVIGRLADADGDGRRDAFAQNGRTLSIGLRIRVGDIEVAVTNGVTAQGALGEESGSCS